MKRYRNGLDAAANNSRLETFWVAGAAMKGVGIAVTSLMVLSCSREPDIILSIAYAERLDDIRYETLGVRSKNEQRLLCGVIYHRDVRRISMEDPVPPSEKGVVMRFDRKGGKGFSIGDRTYSSGGENRWYAVSATGIVTPLNLADDEEKEILRAGGKLAPGILWESKIKPALLKSR